MIKVQKDFDAVPAILTDKEATDVIMSCIRAGSITSDIAIFFKKRFGELSKRLLEIYHNKCAYCESVFPMNSINHIFHYRPKSNYYWLALEWSNLIPICNMCNASMSIQFPIINEKNRVTVPATDRLQWRTDSPSLLGEEPLLINPEIDDPSLSLSFYPDGRMIGLDERGDTTIQILQLNRPELLEKRKAVIDHFRTMFKDILFKFSQFTGPNDQSGLTGILELAFQYPMTSLLKRAEATSEFSLLGRCMIQEFDSFFVEPFENKELQPFLRQAFDIFVNQPGQSGMILRSAGTAKSATPSDMPVERVTVQFISIENIKCFGKKEKMDLSGETTLILGINGRGKSTMLQLLALGLSDLNRPPATNDWLKVVKAGHDKGNFSIRLKTETETIDLNFSIDRDDNITCIRNKEKFKRLRKKLFIAAYGHGRNLNRQDAPSNEKFEPIASLFDNNTYLKNIRDSAVFKYVQLGFKEIQKVLNRILALADSSHPVTLDHFDTNSFYFITPTDPSGFTPLEAMSDGFKSAFILVFDMIIRAWEKGIDVQNPETISGIVLIDEIDHHLHPSWQRTIMPTLREVFPNIQFVITSHSPFVVQSMTTDSIILLRLDGESVKGEKIKIKGKPYGHEIEKIIKEVMGDENEVPEVSVRLAQSLRDFKFAVESGNKEEVTRLYLRIKEAIPPDSGFTEYIDIMSAGLLKY